jgi:hypothetical protein
MDFKPQFSKKSSRINIILKNRSTNQNWFDHFYGQSFPIRINQQGVRYYIEKNRQYFFFNNTLCYSFVEGRLFFINSRDELLTETPAGNFEIRKEKSKTWLLFNFLKKYKNIVSPKL